MTFPPVVRVFFAVDLPAASKERLGSFITTLKKKAKSYPIRWSKPENLHITLQFLAEVHSEHLPMLIREVHQAVDGIINSTHLTVGRVHVFPNPYRPRVIVLDVTPQNELAAISKLIGNGISASNYAVEDRPFRAHLTIGRIKQPQGIDLGFLAEFKMVELEDFDVNEVVLFRSEPAPEGSKYTVIEKISLSKKAIAS